MAVAGGLHAQFKGADLFWSSATGSKFLTGDLLAAYRGRAARPATSGSPHRCCEGRRWGLRGLPGGPDHVPDRQGVRRRLRLSAAPPALRNVRTGAPRPPLRRSPRPGR
ncbi:MAG: hypothetical protein HZY73_07060 [Micropruina sp.]|nr:MAG: hypothetical protein HZY73_07060 [Micropruina sp.]